MSAKAKIVAVSAAVALAATVVVTLPANDANATVRINESNQVGCSARAGLVHVTFYDLESRGEYNFAVFSGKKASGSPLYVGTHRATIGGAEAHVLSCPNLGKGTYTVTLRSRKTGKKVATGSFVIR